jgi:hypothetical protein
MYGKIQLAFTRRLSTHPAEDLERAAAQLNAELVATRLALEMARRGEPEEDQPRVGYERDVNFSGDYSELVVSFSTHRVLGEYARILGEAVWEAEAEWVSDEDPPDVVEIVRADDGLPAGEENAAEAMRGVCNCPLPLWGLGGDEPGKFATALPEGFPKETTAYTDTEDWTVRVLSRRRGG